MIWEELEKARNTLYEIHKIVTEMDKEKQMKGNSRFLVPPRNSDNNNLYLYY